MPRSLPEPLLPGTPWSALAPMQDITDRAFLGLIAQYGPPDFYFTEYFRVHACSRLEPHILDTVLHHGTGRPVFAQVIGEDRAALVRAARELAAFPVAGLDLNLGCPAPKVYKKNVGGGLLREPERVDAILADLREAWPGLLTVKMRYGFEDDRHYGALLEAVARRGVDLLSVHARTVRQMYRGEGLYRYVAQAVRSVPCPVLANGNVSSAAKAREVLAQTGAAGVMVGRGAIRNPWIFAQIRASQTGATPPRPTLGEVHAYLERLWLITIAGGVPERVAAARVKKYLNFVGLAVDPAGEFLHAMRRATTRAELQDVSERFLRAGGRADRPFPEEPWPGLVARPSREADGSGPGSAGDDESCGGT